jgi:hypothetical protein
MARFGGSEVVSAPLSEGLGRDEKLALVDRIIATAPFRNSERLVSFLVHVCRMEADGLADDISEQQIGESVFGRPKNYDPSVDGIVRSHASRLRIRLDQYFNAEGSEERIRVSIPRGAYVPLYEPRLVDHEPQTESLPAPVTSAIQEPRPVPETFDPGSDLRSVERRSFGRMLATAILLAVSFLAGTYAKTWPVSRLEAILGWRSPSEVFWGAVFVPGRTTTLVVGDAGVNMFENLAKRQVAAEEYSSHSWLNEPLAQTPPGYSWVPIPARSYTPWFVVGFAARMASLPEARDGQLKTISARELTLDSLKNDQLVLIGGPEYNPWEQLLGNDQNFRVVFDGEENSISILNKQPEPGEPPMYKWRQTEPRSHLGYSLIAFGKNLNGNGRILELEGSTAQGDEAAAEFLLDSRKMDPILKKAITRDGRLSEFEMVLQTNFVAGGNFDSRVIAFRVHP